MTYNEIHEFLYGGEGANSLDQLTPEDRLPWQVIRLFDSRGGFDHWWEDIDEDTQDDIFDDLRALLKAAQVKREAA